MCRFGLYSAAKIEKKTRENMQTSTKRASEESHEGRPKEIEAVATRIQQVEGVGSGRQAPVVSVGGARWVIQRRLMQHIPTCCVG